MHSTKISNEEQQTVKQYIVQLMLPIAEQSTGSEILFGILRYEAPMC